MRAVKLGLIALALALGGCQSTTPVVTIERPRLVVPHVDPITLQPVRWYIVKKGVAAGDPGSFEYVWNQTNASTLYVIDGYSFRNNMNNHSQFGRLIRQQKAQSSAYKKYYERYYATKVK